MTYNVDLDFQNMSYNLKKKVLKMKYFFFLIIPNSFIIWLSSMCTYKIKKICKSHKHLNLIINYYDL